MNIEHVEAAKRGMTLRVYQLQKKLRGLPLAPHTETLRKKRTELSKELIRCARIDKCISRINLMAGSSD